MSSRRPPDRSLARGLHRGNARVMRYRQEIGRRLHLHRLGRLRAEVAELRAELDAFRR